MPPLNDKELAMIRGRCAGWTHLAARRDIERLIAEIERLRTHILDNAYVVRNEVSGV